LLYNIRIIKDIIISKNIYKDVSVIISDNCSPDNTYNIISQEISLYEKIQINVFKQNSNIGGPKNTHFTISKANTDFCMLLGDDDYINADYLVGVVNEIKTNKDLACVFPSNRAIYPDKTYVNGIGQNLNIKKRYYKKGFLNCYMNISKATQLSGLTFKKGELLKLFSEKNMNNLYPQVFFMMKSCLNGQALFLADFPVLVTHIPQIQKDWDYGDYALLPDIFENCINLDLSMIKCSLLEIRLITGAKYLLRTLKYKNIISLAKNENTYFIAGCFLLLYTPFIKFEKVLKNIYWKFKRIY